MRKLLFIFVFTVTLIKTYSQETLNVFDIARNGTEEQVKEVLKTNPKAFNTINNDGFSPLILASYRENNKVAKILITSGCDINANSKMGTALMAAIVKGNTEIAKLLIENKANINSTDGNGTTALLYAVQFKNYEIASLLIKADADYNIKDNRGNSAFDYAILADDDKLIEILKNKKL